MDSSISFPLLTTTDPLLTNPNQGCATTQADGSRQRTAEARARCQVSPRGICGRQIGTGTGFSQSPSDIPQPASFHRYSTFMHVSSRDGQRTRW
jgi:hypothetical protein